MARPRQRSFFLHVKLLEHPCWSRTTWEQCHESYFHVALLLFSHVYLVKVYVVISTRILEFFTSLLINTLLN